MSQAARLLTLVSACERLVSSCKRRLSDEDRVEVEATRRQTVELLVALRTELADLTPQEPIQARRESSSHFKAVGRIFDEEIKR